MGFGRLVVVAVAVVGLGGCFAGRSEGFDPAEEDAATTGAIDDELDDGSSRDGGDAPRTPPPDATTGEPGDGGDEPPDEPGDSTGVADEPEVDPLSCDGRDDLLACDGFDDGAIDETLWSIVDDNGATVSIELDLDVAFHGDGALRVHLPPADGARAGVITSVPFPVAGNHFFGRALLYVGPSAPQTHAAALAASGDLDGTVARYRLDSNGGEFNSRYTHPATVEQHGGLRKFGYDVPEQTWLCVEWEYDGNANEMRYWMDGEAVDSMTVTEASEPQPWIAPVFESFELGYRTFQAGDEPEGYDIYWDAFALATFRIGCG